MSKGTMVLLAVLSAVFWYEVGYRARGYDEAALVEGLPRSV